MNSNKINLANLKAKTQAASERKLQKAPPGTVPSGKYKGRTVEALKADANYVSWLLRNDWFQKKHPDLYAQIGPASVPDVRTQLSKAYAEIAALTETELDEILHDPALNAAYKQHRDYWSYVQSVLDSFDADPYGTTWLLGTCAAAQQLLKFSSGGRASTVKLPVLKGET